MKSSCELLRSGFISELRLGFEFVAIVVCNCSGFTFADGAGAKDQQHELAAKVFDLVVHVIEERGWRLGHYSWFWGFQTMESTWELVVGCFPGQHYRLDFALPLHWLPLPSCWAND